MIDKPGGKVEQKGRLKKEKDKEKKVPVLRISLRDKVPVIINPLLKQINSSQHSKESTKDNDKRASGEVFQETIADKVKLRKRGKDSSSSEVFKITSQSALPDRKRRTSCGSSSSPLSSPLDVEASKVKASENLPSSTSKSIKNTSVCEFPPAKLKRSAKNMDTCPELPYKKVKHCLNNNEVNKVAESSSSSDVMDIHELEVASYEEVSSCEPFNFSSSSDLGKYEDRKNMVDTIPSINISQARNEITLKKTIKDQEPIKSSVSFPQEVKSLKKLKEKECNSGTAKRMNHNDHAYPISYNEALLKELSIDQLLFSDKNGLKNLDSSTVEDFFSHSKELSLANQRANVYIDAITDLVIKISKRDSRVISSKLNGHVKQDSATIQPFPLNHSSQARNNQSIPNVKEEICLPDSTITAVEQFSRSPSSHSPGPKSHARCYRSTHNYSDSFRQEHHVAKEKRKAMDERCIVYVGNIPHNYSNTQLRKRFQKFGTIKDIQIKSKVRCDFNNLDGHAVGSEEIKNYGFITFSSNQEAANAIEHGNLEQELKFQLSFGARRQFVGEEYKDLDGIVAKNENSVFKCNSRTSFRLKHKDDDDFDFRKLLLIEMKARGVGNELFSKA